MHRNSLVKVVRKVAVVCGLVAMVYGFWYYFSGQMAWAHPDKPIAVTSEYRTYFQNKFGRELPQEITTYYPIYQELHRTAVDTLSILDNPYAENARQHMLDTMHHLIPRDQWDNLSPEIVTLMEHDRQLYQFMLQKFHPDSIDAENGMLRYFVEYGYSLGPGTEDTQVFVIKQHTTGFYIESLAFSMGAGMSGWLSAMLFFQGLIWIGRRIEMVIRNSRSQD